MFLQEIAWCIYAAACSYQRKQLEEPYENDIIKPQGGLTTKIYNKLIGEKGTESKQFN